MYKSGLYLKSYVLDLTDYKNQDSFLPATLLICFSLIGFQQMKTKETSVKTILRFLPSTKRR